MQKYLFIVSCILAHVIVHGQECELRMNEVEASENKKKLENTSVLDRKELDELQPTDVGDALTKVPGISLKNYGGLGGLKTFSYRGIGSEHNTVIEDGFVLSNAQIGQVNLGNQMVTNLEEIRFSSSSFKALLPVSAYLSATNLELTTRFNHITNSKLGLQTQVKMGSFGQIEPSIALNKTFGKCALGVYSRYLHFNGEYPYTLNFGDYQYSGLRKNNALTNSSIGATVQYTPDSSRVHRIFAHHQYIDQGLPSAVILYLDNPKEFLNQQNLQFNYDYRKNAKTSKTRIYSSFAKNETRYIDENFQNNEGFLSNLYALINLQTGLVRESKLNEKWKVNYGLEFSYNELQRTNRYSSDSSVTLGKVYRNQMPLMGRLVRENKFSRFQLRLANLFLDEARQGSKLTNLPTATVSYDLLSKNEVWLFQLMSSYTHRLPSFSELYLGSNYNSNLKNEDAFQNSLDVSRSFRNERHQVKIKVGIYWNKVWNKLVATPNKNLFQWTIVNVGQVHAFGDEVNVQHLWKMSRNSRWRMEIQGAYSNQLALDADPLSLNYGQQIAYVPFQTISANLALRYKASGVRVDYFWSDFRYALNQNTQANLLPGFYFIDLSLFHKLKTKKNHYFRVQGSVKNLLGESYYFVRSYPMPGRNFLISLAYEF